MSVLIVDKQWYKKEINLCTAQGGRIMRIHKIQSPGIKAKTKMRTSGAMPEPDKQNKLLRRYRAHMLS